MSAPESRYQQLRARLHYLKLDAAAEALPAQLDDARNEKLSRLPAACGGSRGFGVGIYSRSNAAWIASLRLASCSSSRCPIGDPSASAGTVVM